MPTTPSFTPDAWANNDPTKPLNATRLAKLGTQYAAAMADVAADVDDDTTPIGTALKSTIDSVGRTIFPPIVDAGVPHFYVTKKGNDANDGRSWGAAKATIESALTALAAVTGLNKPYFGNNAGVIDIGYGVFMTDGQISVPSGVMIRGVGPVSTTIRLNPGRNCNVFQSSFYGDTTTAGIDAGLMIKNLNIDGNKANQTGTVYESVVTAQVTTSTVTPFTLTVADTTGLPSSGRVWAGSIQISYTGKTSTTLTGCLKISGENTVLFPLARVIPFASQGHGIALQANTSIIEDVTVANCIGSGFYVTTNGVSVPGIAYENKFIRGRSGGNLRYGWEIGEGATDGTIAFSSGGLNKLGTLILEAVNWHVTDFHPVGINQPDGKGTTPALITICAGMQYFEGLYLDTAMHDGIRFDSQRRQIPIYGVDIDAISLYGSSAGGGAPIIRALGNFSTNATANLTRCNIRVRNGDGNVGHIFINGPRIRHVALTNQNWTTATKAQFNDVSSLPQNGGTVTIAGTLTYTGTQITETIAHTAANTGDTTLTLRARGNLDNSGLVVVTSPTDRVGQVISYTGITMDGTRAILTGIPSSGSGSIVNGFTAGSYVSQHFLTGISSAATSVPNGAFGDASQYAVWEIDKFNVTYQTGTLTISGEPFIIPSTGLSKVQAVDLDNGTGARHIRIDGLATPKSTVGTWAYAQNSASFYSGYNQNSGSSALNDSLSTAEVWLDAGTWTLDLIGFTGTDGAIVTPSLLGIRSRVVTISGTQEQYAASGASKRDTFAGISVPVSGLYSLVLTATSKNGSSSAYRVRFAGALLTRTA